MQRFIYLLTIGIILTHLSVFAQEPSEVITSRKPSITKPSREPHEDISEGLSRKPTRSESMTPDKQRACDALLKNVITRIDNTTNTVNSLLEKFDSISQRVEDYYQSKLIPEGKNLSTYEALLKAIQVKKVAVQTALEDFQMFAGDYTCDQNKPGLSKRDVREKMKALLVAQKEYKTSIRNLIVAVHTLGSNGKPLPSISISPTITPVSTENISPTTTE